ncbi:MAG: dipeptide/oligopeptide/nickel ABC transporter ATP-binding protein [Treponema sp.]|jgi:ABC-type glutathione transport system ATPase component|nr:dipeptide/oligopeptide/nickel ABC transporter ATP-binding protein [Treponema sp.]
MTEPLLSVRDLSCAYTSRSLGPFGKKEVKTVLNRVNLDIRAGEIFGLLGESGCGKTTLARCILGIIEYEGEIFIDGVKREKIGLTRQLAHTRQLARARQAQMVFQDPGASLTPAKKTGGLLEEPLLVHRLGTKEERLRQVDETLIQVGLDPSYKKRRVNELSGGQKQRVCIGRALILQPKLLIADEAISALDVSVGAQILNLFRELNEKGQSILFISHNAGAIEYLCDRVAVIKAGRLLE